jgi:hypothetical protein
VQLDLPAVDEDRAAAPEETADIPVLYPEIEAEVPGAEASVGEGVAGESESRPEFADVEEQLVVSEWPDPGKPAIVASQETEKDEDKDASASG